MTVPNPDTSHVVRCDKFTVIVDPKTSEVWVKGSGINVQISALSELNSYLSAYHGDADESLSDNDYLIVFGRDTNRAAFVDYRVGGKDEVK